MQMDSLDERNPRNMALRPTAEGVRKWWLRRIENAPTAIGALLLPSLADDILTSIFLKNRSDGIHNVEKIRRQRGEAIRRSPTQSSAAKRDKDGSQLTGTPTREALGA
jgi:hypothetical protein